MSIQNLPGIRDAAVLNQELSIAQASVQEHQPRPSFFNKISDDTIFMQVFQFSTAGEIRRMTSVNHRTNDLWKRIREGIFVIALKDLNLSPEEENRASWIKLLFTRTPRYLEVFLPDHQLYDFLPARLFVKQQPLFRSKYRQTQDSQQPLAKPRVCGTLNIYKGLIIPTDPNNSAAVELAAARAMQHKYMPENAFTIFESPLPTNSFDALEAAFQSEKSSAPTIVIKNQNCQTHTYRLERQISGHLFDIVAKRLPSLTYFRIVGLNEECQNKVDVTLVKLKERGLELKKIESKKNSQPSSTRVIVNGMSIPILNLFVVKEASV